MQWEHAKRFVSYLFRIFMTTYCFSQTWGFTSCEIFLTLAVIFDDKFLVYPPQAIIYGDLCHHCILGDRVFPRIQTSIAPFIEVNIRQWEEQIDCAIFSLAATEMELKF